MRDRSFSLTWAVQEAQYLLSPLTKQSNPVNWDSLIASARNLPVLLVEQAGSRQAMSPSDLDRHPHFWTVHCGLFRSAELLIREVKSEASLSNLVQALQVEDLRLPSDPILCETRFMNEIVESTFHNREVDTVALYPTQRRVDLRWSNVGTDSKWWVLPEDIDDPRLGEHSTANPASVQEALDSQE
jgi:hypothetical protein